MNENQSRLFALALVISANRSDAEDLTQDIFIRAYTSFHTYDPERPVQPWLYAIALNTCRTYLKKKKQRAAEYLSGPEAEACPDPAPGPEEQAIKQGDTARVRQCLQKLPPKLMDAVILRYLQDLSFEETAEALGISTSSAKMRVYRGLQKLKTLMTTPNP